MTEAQTGKVTHQVTARLGEWGIKCRPAFCSACFQASLSGAEQLTAGPCWLSALHIPH